METMACSQQRGIGLGSAAVLLVNTRVFKVCYCTWRNIIAASDVDSCLCLELSCVMSTVVGDRVKGATAIDESEEGL